MKKILLFLLMAIIMVVPMGAVQAVAPSETDAPSLVGSAGTVILDNKNSTTWARITDGKYGVLTYNSSGISFDFTLNAQGLEDGVEYSLIYFANPYPGNNPGALIWATGPRTGTTISISGAANLGMNLPTAPDTNQVVDHSGAPDYYAAPFNYGAKIWLVPTECYDVSSKSVIVWSPDRFLFETGLINYIDTDKTDDGGETIGLITTIIEPSISFTVTAGDPEGTINFGNVMIGTDSGERNITITNTGALPIKITTLVSAGFYADCLSLQTPTLAYVKANVWQYTPIAPGASLTIKAKVHPTAAYATASVTGNITFLAQLP